MAFIHPQAVIEGDVKLGKNVTICACAVLRGDEGQIAVGDNSNVQDCAVVHRGAQVGKGVSIGHGAVVHGCVIGDNVIVGMNATILNDAIIGDNVIIAAGALVTEGKKIDPSSLVMGIPGKVVRQLGEEDKEKIRKNAQMYVEKALPERKKI